MKVALSSGNFALVDSSDAKTVSEYAWSESNGYAVHTKYLGGGRKNMRRKTIHMHRLIMDAPKGMTVDHINGNRLDNRRDNLRVCTIQQNNMNVTKRRESVSGMRGVYPFNSGKKVQQKWIAKIRFNKKLQRIGVFSSKEEAHIAYLARARELFGDMFTYAGDL